MAPPVSPNRVRRTEHHPILPPDNKKTTTTQPQQQLNAVDQNLRQTKLSELQWRGWVEKTRLQKMAFEKQQTQTPEPPPDLAVDGHYLGADGKTYSPNTPLKDIPAVEPRGGAKPGAETIIYTNGILTNTKDQAGSLQKIADQTGLRVIGVRNATEKFEGSGLDGVLGTINGVIRDGDQVFNDKLNIGTNPAVDTLADTVYKEINAGRGVHLMAHSQGGTVTSRALNDVKNRLIAEDGLSNQEAERRMGLIKVETFAAAAATYPDGPQYVHYINRNDIVPQTLGLGEFSPISKPGAGAVVHYFREGAPVISHPFEKYYLDHRVPFDDAIKGNFKEPEAPAEINPVTKAGEELGDLARKKAIEFGNFVADKAVQTKNFVQEKAVEAGNFIQQKAIEAKNYAEQKAVKAAVFAAEKALETKKFVEDKAAQAKKFVEDKAAVIGNKITQTKLIVDAAVTVAKNAVTEKLNQAKIIAEAGWKVFTASLPWN